MSKLFPILEVAAWIALLLGYAFYLQSYKDYYVNHISLVAIFVFVLVSLFRRKPPMAELGIQMKTFGQATVSILPFLVLFSALVLTIVRLRSHSLFPPTLEKLVTPLAGLILWGLLQQFLLQSYVCVRIQNSVKDEFAAASYAGCLYGLAHLHLEKPWIALPATAFGVCCSLHFIKHKNLLVLGIAHGILASLSLYTEPQNFVGGFLMDTQFQRAFDELITRL